MPKKLKYGETPFHHMKPDELLKAAIRMYDACVHARCALRLCQNSDLYKSPYNPFWTEGTGGGALECCNQVVEPLEKKFGSEAIYRMFYRAADDLLWEDRPPIYLRTNWAVCDICGTMVGNGYPKARPSHVGERCGDVCLGDGKCSGILRAMTWKDIGMK